MYQYRDTSLRVFVGKFFSVRPTRFDNFYRFIENRRTTNELALSNFFLRIRTFGGEGEMLRRWKMETEYVFPVEIFLELFY